MRRSLRPHLPTVAAALACLVVAGSMALVLPPPGDAPAMAFLERPPLALPPPEEDQDLDSYADAVDRTDGDLLVLVDLLALHAPGGSPEPYVLLGTQQDHLRFGRGAELEWLHLVDHDPLGHRPGSAAWQRALRTGTWVMSIPHQDLERGIAVAGHLDLAAPSGATWPQRLALNVRDDRALIVVQLELWDAAPKPHRQLGAWSLTLDLAFSRVRSDEANATFGFGDPAVLGRLDPDGPDAGLRVAVHARPDLDHATKQAVADRNAPVLRFDSTEALYPVSGEALTEFHGFGRRASVLRTWDQKFNNGRDEYRLFLGDYTADGEVDHRDAKVIGDVMLNRGGGRIYAHVTQGALDQVIVQYWFLYAYNFVRDERGDDIPSLAHRGDREFVQLRFRTLADALNGTPISVAFSQHYEGIRFEGLQDGLPPYQHAGHGGHPSVYIAAGSHASYPVPGSDRARRPAFVGFHDRFDGQGQVWMPGNYTVEVLGNQEWHMGRLWGPATRYARDLGTSLRPLLQYDFRYPYTDPLSWEQHLETIPPGEAAALFGGTT